MSIVELEKNQLCNGLNTKVGSCIATTSLDEPLKTISLRSLKLKNGSWGVYIGIYVGD
jgi:hypothetical protein